MYLLYKIAKNLLHIIVYHKKNGKSIDSCEHSMKIYDEKRQIAYAKVIDMSAQVCYHNTRKKKRHSPQKVIGRYVTNKNGHTMYEINKTGIPCLR